MPKLSQRRRNCLLDYDMPERDRPPAARDWTQKEQTWALENDLLKVGPEIGAHILTEKGRKVLQDDFIQSSQPRRHTCGYERP